MVKLPALLAAVLTLAPATDAPPSAVPDATPWAELVATPQTHVGKRARVVLQVHSLDETWNPFLTRFAPGEYVALNAWSDEQLPWIQADWQAPAARVFVRRGSLLETRVRLLERHERVLLTCVVREVLAGAVWAEAFELASLHRYIPEGTVLHAIRGIEAETPTRAAQEFERALAAPVPARAQAALRALQARCTRDD